MLKLLRMNFYRILHTKGLIVIFAITLAIALGSSALLYSESDISVSDYSEEDPESGSSMYDAVKAGYEDAEAEAKETETEAAEGGAASEETTEASEEEGDTLYFGYESKPQVVEGASLSNAFRLVSSDMASCLPLLLIGIGAIIFVGAESKNGFTKNLVSHNVSKSQVYMAKTIAYAIYSLVLMTSYLLVAVISLSIYYYGDTGHMEFSMELFPEFIKYFGLQYLLTLAYVGGLILLNTVTKSTAISITMCTLTTTGFIAGLILFPLEMKFDIELAKYTLAQAMTSVDFGASQEMLNLALAVGVITLLIYNVLGNIWVSKRDVV